MDALQERALLKPISRVVSIKGQDYRVFDPVLSKIRAEIYLNEALVLIEAEKMSDSAHQKQIHHKLLVATDYGCGQAPYLLAMRILQGFLTDYSGTDAVVLLGIASDRRHKQASYCLGCCYAGRPDFSRLMILAKDFFAEIDPDDRKALADYYLSLSEQTENNF